MPIEWDFSKRIAIRNLGETATKNEIKSLFEKYGKISKLWVARNPPGLAFLEYEYRRDAKAAARLLDGKRCCGCRIKVDLTTHSPRSSHSRDRSREHEPRTSRGRQRLDARVNNPNRSRHSALQRRASRTSCENVDEPTSTRRLRPRNSDRDESLKPSTAIRTRSRTSESQRLDCSICFDNVVKRKPTITPCRHVFCSPCIRKAIRIKGKCPLCQADTLENQLLPIYLNP